MGERTEQCWTSELVRKDVAVETSTVTDARLHTRGVNPGHSSWDSTEVCHAVSQASGIFKAMTNLSPRPLNTYTRYGFSEQDHHQQNEHYKTQTENFQILLR